ncbi:hypothetical protein ACH95_18530 [Bacillus glycinifermentans]|uniref:Uncharacterized protein n=1 Tax=Bacillus glycinifermentans TaxID=1664069 RepID=A0A0J6E5B8_9BACI|nr:hypothetical protein COP00_17640 [Bacillus glycinifermentans]KMM55801.1 hypothetical protein ACH95_18530 [Bacillus glycinifermentans]KRT95629.1 hypothetical protein AB447_200510 [Bacillus glycinifermentans]
MRKRGNIFLTSDYWGKVHRTNRDGQTVKHAADDYREEINDVVPPAKKDRDTGHVEKTGGNHLPAAGNDGLHHALRIEPILFYYRTCPASFKQQKVTK